VRWRFVDHVDGFQRWTAISGRKCVSLEEYCLADKAGRDVALPESLVLESCVELGRWLAAASSEFTLTAALCEVRRFAWARPAGMGEVLRMDLCAERIGEEHLCIACSVHCGPERVAEGTVTVALMPLEEGFDAAVMRARWEELRGAT
jgi:hypothetical protein